MQSTLISFACLLLLISGCSTRQLQQDTAIEVAQGVVLSTAIAC